MQRIALVGPMGAGKTSVGRQLAADLHLPFLDLDEEIVRVSGRQIADIFQTDGEPGFREIEYNVLRDITHRFDRQGCVLATGGGVVVTEENRCMLRMHWHTVWLQASVETLIARLQQDATVRPLLQSQESLAKRVRSLCEVREPWYREVAHCAVRVDGKTVSEIAEEICRSVGHTIGGGERPPGGGSKLA